MESVTLDDVARLSGVSRATASRALNGRPGVRPDVRERVREVADLMRNRARSFLYTTGLPPGILAAAIAALELIEQDPGLVTLPLARATRFAEAVGLPRPESPIVPIVLGDVERTLRAAERLERRGFLVVPIRPPTVPEGTARLRCTFSAAHTDDEVERFATAVTEVLEAR